ncbi:hypothetical protein [Pseudolysinimonas kribbensis]|uniref:hypothetical protein n=1 Tax=Pseudolysinimonas kribbensis TaxID=433641 RepID=UPI0024E15C40|nr:hypothetical protein [Pseudolysinimonas kribbensis]
MVWDDGDPLLGEPLAPYVHARDAALIRQEQQGSALVLAGHTRTTDVERLVEVGWVRDAAPARLSRPHVIPTANIDARDRLAARARIPSVAWREASEAARRGPVLVQVARPGYAPGLRCAECGEAARCRRCGGPLRQARAGGVPSCGWCGSPDAAWACATCGGTRLRPSGAGATRTAEDLGRAFPGIRIVIADGERTVREVGPEPAIVIATRGAEPIAAGATARCCCSTATGWWLARVCASGRTCCAGGPRRAPWPPTTPGSCSSASAAPSRPRWSPATPPHTLEPSSPTGAPCGSRPRCGWRRCRAGPTPWRPGCGPSRGRRGGGHDGRWGRRTLDHPLRLRARSGRRRRAACRGHPAGDGPAQADPGAPRRGRQPLPLKVRLDDPDPFAE